MPDIVATEAGCVQEFLEKVFAVSKQPHTEMILFRGQFRDFPLLPKLFRKPNTPLDVRKHEDAMLQTLKHVGPHLRPSQPTNDWDWLSLGQHYGMSTRMSDWTANPLIALFFSVEFDGAEITSPIVYQYPITHEIIETEKTGSPLIIPHTRVIRPNGHSHRSESQAAWHIVHAIHQHENGEYRFIPLADMAPHNTRISRIRVASSRVQSIRSELSGMGINHSTIYGDYQSVCRSIAPAFGLA
jgi:hypothetical protein